MDMFRSGGVAFLWSGICGGSFGSRPMVLLYVFAVVPFIARFVCYVGYESCVVVDWI